MVASWVASVLAGTAAVFAAERRPGAGAGTRAGRALLPLVAVATYLTSHWVTTRVADDA